MKNKAKNSFEGSENYGKRKMVIASISLITVFMLAMSGCKKNEDLGLNNNDNPAGSQNAITDADLRMANSITYLVSDEASYHPAHVDPNLVNAWGMSFTPSGQIWVNSNEKGLAAAYDGEGNTIARSIIIPSPDGTGRGKPTGSVYFYYPLDSRFIIPSTGETSKMIFSTEDGTIAAWSSGPTAVIVADRSRDHAIYKGLAVAYNAGAWMLYATDFHNKKIDMFNERFELVGSRGFRDEHIPDGYAPFGIRAFGSKIVVTYALQDKDGEDDVAGPGNGYVDIYKVDGTLLRRFASGGSLNSPWGIETFIPARHDHMQTELNPDVERRAILIGNFGDGRISVFDGSGNYLGQIQGREGPLSIDGLWAISYKPMGTDITGDNGRLYFTAGPAHEEHGLFGYITSQ